MQIDGVELTHIELALKGPFEMSIGVMHKRHLILVKVLAEGAHGWGEVSTFNNPDYTYETPSTAWHILTDYLIAKTLGQRFSHPAEVPRLFSAIRGHYFAKAGLENAIWDVYARTKGIPLARILGGTRERVEVGVSVGIQRDPRELIRVVDSYLLQGYRRIKVKIKPGRDVEDLRALRRAFSSVPIIADANSAYTLDDIPTFRALDELGLMMYEQPLAWDDLVDHAKLQAAVCTPICLDESIRTPEDARKALELGSCRIINIKVGRVGGHHAAKAIHDLMHAKGLPVWCGGMLESGVGRAHNIHAATLSGYVFPGDTSASNRYYEEDIVDEPATLNEDGTLTVPERPGIGVEVLHERLKRYGLRTYARHV